MNSSILRSAFCVARGSLLRATNYEQRVTKKGFTLIEILITTAIVSMVAVALYLVLAGGIKIWRRGTEVKTYERNVRFTLEKMSGELRNCFKYSDIAFEGEEDFFRFCALVLVESETAEGQVGTHHEVGRITYFYDEKKNTLLKKEECYSEACNETDEPDDEGRVLIQNISEVEFSYCYLDNAANTYKWKEDWKKDEQGTIPLAINIKMVLKKEKQEEDIEKIIFIPIGTGEQMLELGK